MHVVLADSSKTLPVRQGRPHDIPKERSPPSHAYCWRDALRLWLHRLPPVVGLRPPLALLRSRHDL
jgi:hypothetical protein